MSAPAETPPKVVEEPPPATPRKKRRGVIFSVFMLLAHLAGALTSIQAVMETRTSQGAIAWAISLNTFPYVAVPAYWVFGRTKFEGYVLARERDRMETNPVARQLREELTRERVENPALEREVQLLEKLSRMPFTAGNSAELLIDGEQTFASIFQSIAAAREYVLVQFYIIRDDGLGRKLRDALLAKAKQGVRCYVLYDEIGSLGLPEAYINALRAGGVQMLPFNSTQGSSNRFQINFRNHRKIVIADGLVAFVGGANVGDEYLGKDAKHSPWRDTHVKVTGPAVQCVQVSWLEDWHWASGKNVDLNWEVERAPGGECAVLCLPSGPADDLETATLFFLQAINMAKTRLWIASPYFVPDEQIMSALQLAALRGVDVRILMPRAPDSELVRLSAFSYFEEGEKAGIKFYHHVNG
ncbi:MAG: cardiolipin synthase, partial [Chthoniobacteraceae bacterium]